MTKPLFDVFRESMMDNANGSRREQQDDFIARMKSNPAYLELLASDYFERMAAVYVVRTETPANKSFGRTEVAMDKAGRMSKPRTSPAPVALVRRTRQEAQARTALALAEMKAKVRSVILLDLVLPNGKALREATGAECAKAGGFFAAVAQAIKPTQVVDRHLSEGDLQNIRSRFFQTNTTTAQAA